MVEFLSIVGEIITTPLLRWICISLSIINTILQYINEPLRFSYKIGFMGLSYKWLMYGIYVLICVTTVLDVICLEGTIPFTNLLPKYWYVYIFILYLALITQITLDSKQYTDDGSFNPPPSYMFPQKYRVMFAYFGLIIDFIVMLQIYIYFGISDITKKTILSRYITERFGGWAGNNKLEFLFEWSGILNVLVKLYILLSQKNFQACNYGLPPSWNA